MKPVYWKLSSQPSHLEEEEGITTIEEEDNLEDQEVCSDQDRLRQEESSHKGFVDYAKPQGAQFVCTQVTTCLSVIVGQGTM